MGYGQSSNMAIKMDICENITSPGNFTQILGEDGIHLPDLYTLVTGAVIFFSVLPFVLFHFRFCPIGSTSAVLLGSVLLVAFQVVPQDEAYEVMTRRCNVQFIFMLTGVLVIAYLVDREQVIGKVLRRCLKPGQSFETYLLVVCIVTFILTALFTNDACCAILTPALLKLWESQDRHKHEVDVLLLGIATSANLASVTSLFGSVQIALVSTRTFGNEYFKSHLDLRTCIMYLLPTATVTFFINFAFLLIHFRVKRKWSERTKLISEPSRSEQEMAGLTKDEARTYTNGFVRRDHFDDDVPTCPIREERLINPCQLETIPEDEVLEIQTSPSLESQALRLRYIDDTSSDSSSDSDEGISSPSASDPNDNIFTVDYRPSSAQSLHRSNNININMNLHLTGSNNSLDRALKQQGLRIYRRLGIYRSLSAVSPFEFLAQDVTLEAADQTESSELRFSVSASQSLPFQIILGILMATVIGCFLASAGGIIFDLGLIPIGAATMALIFDAILNRKSAMATLKTLDWSVVVLFMGLFVLMHGLQTTRLPQYLWDKAGLTLSPFSGIQDIAILYGVAMVMSAMFSNVPMTLIVLMQLHPCAEQLPFVLLLVWLASTAGNLTLYSSVGNAIVAQKANHILSHRLTFWKHLQYGFLTTLLTSCAGVVIISGLLRIH